MQFRRGRVVFTLLFLSALISQPVHSASGFLTRPGICENVLTDIGDADEADQSFRLKSKETTANEKAAILGRFREAIGPATSDPFLERMATANDEVSRWRPSVAEFASYSSPELLELTQGYNLSRDNLAILEESPGYNKKVRLIAFNSANAMMALSLWALTPHSGPAFWGLVPHPGFTIAMISGMVAVKNTTSAIFSKFSRDQQRNLEFEFLSQLASDLQQDARSYGNSAAQEYRRFRRRVGRDNIELLSSRDPDGSVRLDIVRWR